MNKGKISYNRKPSTWGLIFVLPEVVIQASNKGIDQWSFSVLMLMNNDRNDKISLKLQYCMVVNNSCLIGLKYYWTEGQSCSVLCELG